ncbi:hypothetical protein AX17_001231 [Amanita inopinata Kibby_2008]|nr:hypothetical protein AX17_001231 [Amanita inopinata Kibby_2008]
MPCTCPTCHAHRHLPTRHRPRPEYDSYRMPMSHAFPRPNYSMAHATPTAQGRWMPPPFAPAGWMSSDDEDDYSDGDSDRPRNRYSYAYDEDLYPSNRGQYYVANSPVRPLFDYDDVYDDEESDHEYSDSASYTGYEHYDDYSNGDYSD